MISVDELAAEAGFLDDDHPETSRLREQVTILREDLQRERERNKVLAAELVRLREVER